MILGEETVTLQRCSTSMARGSDGRISSSLTFTESEILMSVQPLNGKEIAMLPEGERHRHSKKGYTISEVLTADQHAQNIADRVVVDGIVYEVHTVEQQRAIIPHYKVTMLRLQELDPGFGA